MPRVRVEYGGSWAADVVERGMGVPPLDIPPVRSPVLTVDGRIEPDATAWLAEVHARTGGTWTARTHAESLQRFAAFLLERNTALRAARNRHILEYLRHRTADAATRVSGATWQRDRTAIKQFYEWLLATQGVALPFTLDVVPTRRGPVASMREGRGVPLDCAAGTPLEPPQIPELLAAARRVGAQAEAGGSGLTGARDAAFIALGLACGARADTLAHLTIWELPDPSLPGDLVEMYLPGAVSKSRREVRLLAFRRHLQAVYDYLDPHGGTRRQLLRGWRPPDPIRIAGPPLPGRREVFDTAGNRYQFNTMTAGERRRLLTPGGEPAMLFLSARDGAPLSYRAAEELTSDASRLAEARARTRGAFFPHVHTHDLRHTYATHLAALYMLGLGPEAELPPRSGRLDARSAVRLAATGLGHVDAAVTAGYARQAGRMCRTYSASELLGRMEEGQ
ncbi:site-specific integrase [Arthrobacter mobilis]|uniref:Tyrosine-type recombinase/integrase n=1 Tax=Arthrobacter mobilis TaxID=2724944 RepID=A0A7X6HAY1_9MICC|nr:site-specific integrase [Arthrobacter mobilis]NKX53626.1 tyrosine-type recombinase/integrase [Arthrobacter mobilis]